MRSRMMLMPLFLFAATAPLSFASESPDAAASRFLTVGEQVKAEINAAQPSAQTITTLITGMLEAAKPVVTAYGELHPACEAQLAKVLELYPQLDVWTPTEIRRNIEGGAALPAGEGCYPARDIVAHPAIVRALVRTGVIDQALKTRLARELNEALEHMGEIADELDGE